MQDRIVLKNDIHAQCADREHERTSVIHILELQSLLEKLLAQVNNGFSLGQGVYGCSRVSKFLPGIQHRKDLLGKPAGEQFLCFEFCVWHTSSGKLKTPLHTCRWLESTRAKLSASLVNPATTFQANFFIKDYAYLAHIQSGVRPLTHACKLLLR